MPTGPVGANDENGIAGACCAAVDLWLQSKPVFNIIVCFVSLYLHDSSELEIK